jgi:hypothetical protein
MVTMSHKRILKASHLAPIILFGLSMAMTLNSADAETSTSKGDRRADVQLAAGNNGHEFYHLRYLLTPGNCELSVSNKDRKPRYSNSNAYKFEQGGQFEVFIRYSEFPIATETPDNEPEFMILRMPYTSPEEPNADQKIANKRVLFDRIQQMKAEGKGSVEVIIELAHVTLVEKQPISVKMKGINVFFRHASGSYIDYTGPLKGEKRVD